MLRPPLEIALLLIQVCLESPSLFLGSFLLILFCCLAVQLEGTDLWAFFWVLCPCKAPQRWTIWMCVLALSLTLTQFVVGSMSPVLYRQAHIPTT